MSNKNFIITKDKETANQLKQSGCTLLYEDNGQWTFLNEARAMTFAENKVAYTNTLCM